MNKEWVKVLARDLTALGGIPFLILTIVRVSFGEIYYPMQFIISSALFFILNSILKGRMRAGIGLILVIFTSLYYNHALFTIFALLVYVGIVVSLFYLERSGGKILKGILLGLISAAAGYAVVKLIFF